MSGNSDLTIEVNTDQEIYDLFDRESTREQGFNLLVKVHQERLYWHIRRMLIHHEDTNDVLQNVFIKAWKGFQQFRRESSIYTWLYRIATNECLSFIEKVKKNRSLSLSDHESGWSNRVRAEKGFDSNKLEWKLQLAIQSLPDKQRAIFNLRYYDEMPYEQMSKVLDSTVGSLKASYHFAAKKVQEFILKSD